MDNQVRLNCPTILQRILHCEVLKYTLATTLLTFSSISDCDKDAQVTSILHHLMLGWCPAIQIREEFKS